MKMIIKDIEENTWITNLEETKIHLVIAFVEFLTREKKKRIDDTEFLFRVNSAISYLTQAFHIPVDKSPLQINKNIEKIFFLAVREDLSSYDVERTNITAKEHNNMKIFEGNNGREINTNGTPEKNRERDAHGTLVDCREKNTSDYIDIREVRSERETIGNGQDTIAIHKDKDNGDEYNANLDNGTGEDLIKEITNVAAENGGNIEVSTPNINDIDLFSVVGLIPKEDSKKIHVFLHCDVCTRTFKEEKELKDHKRTCISSYSCDTCGETFSQSSRLTKHKNIHSRVNTKSDDIGEMKFYNKGKTDSCVTNDKNQADSPVTSNKRSHTEVEKESQSIENDTTYHRRKLSRMNNFEVNMTAEVKEEHVDNDCDIDIKDEMIAIEDELNIQGIEDPLTSVEPIIPLNHGAQVAPGVQLDPCEPFNPGNNMDTLQPMNSSVIKILKDLQNGMKLLASQMVANHENLNKKIDENNEKMLEMGIATNSKLDFLTKEINKRLPRATFPKIERKWKTVFEFEDYLKNGEHGTQDHIISMFKDFTRRGNQVQPIKDSVSRILDYIFSSKEEAATFTGQRKSKNKYKLVETVPCVVECLTEAIKSIYIDCSNSEIDNLISVYFNIAPKKTFEAKMEKSVRDKKAKAAKEAAAAQRGATEAAKEAAAAQRGATEAAKTTLNSDLDCTGGPRASTRRPEQLKH